MTVLISYKDWSKVNDINTNYFMTFYSLSSFHAFYTRMSKFYCIKITKIVE